MSRKHPDAKVPYRQPTNPGTNGRARCRWCWGEVNPPRRTFCGEACLNEFRVERDWGWVRQQVFKRDAGKCLMCGYDTQKISRVLRWSRHWDWKIGAYEISGMMGKVGIVTGWEADHILPRADGGGNELQNLRTLCLDCHKGVTKAFAGERARRRREASATLYLGKDTTV